MASLNYTLTAVFKNKKAVRALGVAARYISETCEDSWNPEAQKALKAMQYAIANIHVCMKQDGTPLFKRKGK